MTTNQRNSSSEGLCDQDQHNHNAKIGTDTESIHPSPSLSEDEETLAKDERSDTPESSGTPLTDSAYEDFIEQAQGRFQDRPLGSRVYEDEVPFVDRAIAEVRTLRERVESLTEQEDEDHRDLSAVIGGLDTKERENERLQKICDAMEEELQILIAGATEMRAILGNRKD